VEVAVGGHEVCERHERHVAAVRRDRRGRAGLVALSARVSDADQRVRDRARLVVEPVAVGVAVVYEDVAIRVAVAGDEVSCDGVEGDVAAIRRDVGVRAAAEDVDLRRAVGLGAIAGDADPNRAAQRPVVNEHVEAGNETEIGLAERDVVRHEVAGV
jgi:hypothetical protein